MKIREKVLIMFGMADEVGVQRLKEEVEDVVVVPTLDEAKLLKEVADAAVIVVGPPPVAREAVHDVTTKMIQTGEKLKAAVMIGRPGDLLDFRLATSRGMVVLTSGLHGPTVAEHSLALMLCAAKRIQYLGEEFRRGRFTYNMRLAWRGDELTGKTAGLVGFGNIGRCLAAKLKYGFDMKVLAYDPHVMLHQADEMGVTLVDRLSTLLAGVDFVFCQAQLTGETRHIIGSKELAQMKRTAYLVNTTPGLVDEQALTEALQKGIIAGAGIDVYDPDPPEDPVNNPLFAMPNVALTPHMAGFGKDHFRRVALDQATQIIAFLRGEKPRYVLPVPPK